MLLIRTESNCVTINGSLEEFINKFQDGNTPKT